jgi:hypothetical protein
MGIRFFCFLLLAIVCIHAGCANITTPTGGKRDKTPPKLLSVVPADSLLNTRPKRIELTFDEYITVSDVSKEVQISPILSLPPTVIGINKRAIVKIVDTLLEDSTTYRISFGNAIKDLHEGNAFTRYTYTFSTGTYFDSLQLGGSVIAAETGLPDSSGLIIALYGALENDSSVVRKKPRYVTKVNQGGIFLFKGLPRKSFRIYAIKDVNGNLIYDGPIPGERIAFNDTLVVPGDTTIKPVVLRTFMEIPDTASKKTDSLKSKGQKSLVRQGAKDTTFSYSVNLDTGNVEKRTFDINGKIKITFSKVPVLNEDKIRLSYDSAGTVVSPAVIMNIDTPHPKELWINSNWSQDMVYTLRLAKGFAKDSSGKELMPAKYIFRTMEEATDYGKIRVNLPSKYHGSGYVLLVASEKDTIYNKPVRDTVIRLTRVKPATYTFRIIVDKNGNGIWDTGDLLGHLQPEEVIPFPEPFTMKAGWENIIDFEQKLKPPAIKQSGSRSGASPQGGNHK